MYFSNTRLIVVDGKHVVTVEGIGNAKNPHPVQEVSFIKSMADSRESQRCTAVNVDFVPLVS